MPRPVACAHFHHGLRGADADEDADFAAALSERFGIPCRVGRGSVPRDGRHSPNDAARRVRYAFLEESARMMGANLIATAHTADDQAETVLLRTLRGTSVDGIAGIPPWRRLPSGLVVIRPILSQRRADVEAYCQSRGVTPRRDPSNTKDRYTRSRIRKRIPELAAAFNPRLVDALGRLAVHAAADSDLLNSLTDALEERVTQFEPGVAYLNPAELTAAHPALRSRVLLRALRYVAEEVGFAEESATSIAVEALESLLAAGRGQRGLPGNLRAEIDPALRTLEIAPGPVPVTFPVPMSHADTRRVIPLSIPGSVTLPWATGGAMTLSARLWASGEPPAPRIRRARCVDIAMPIQKPPLAVLPICLAVRPTRPGDRIAPLGMGGNTRPVRDLLAEAKIPQRARFYFPIVFNADTDEILWLIGIAQSESTRVPDDPSGVPIVRLNVE